MGLDIGSTTAKLVVLTPTKKVIYQKYCRHFSNIKNTALEMLNEVLTQYPDAKVTINISGSAGMRISEQIDIPFVQEVIACTEAVEYYIPETDVVIELGGEDAKIIYFENGVEQRMNAACAGGTGAFIDQIAALLQTDASGMNTYAKNHQKIYPIASRCGVFAKTDVQPLLNEGAQKEDIAASVFQSVVIQTISGLACGRPIRGKIAFLGGPLTYLSELRQRFIETLNLQPDEVIFPSGSEYFVARGAAFCSMKNESLALSDICQKLKTLSMVPKDATNTGLPPLFQNETEIETFRQRHQKAKVNRRNLAA